MEQQLLRPVCQGCAGEVPLRLRLDGSVHGRQPKVCSTACRSKAKSIGRGSYAERACASCGDPFKHPMRNAMYCSNACKIRACRVRSGEQLKRDQRFATRSKNRALVRFSRAKSAADRALAKCERKFVVSVKPARPCLRCGEPLVGRRRRWCSKACEKKSDGFRNSKAVSRKVRKMRLRGVATERFTDIEILERDGWICQICGVGTPRELRGTYHPDAPEVDHIVPVAKGGSHARSNVQCACRACNGAKGVRLLPKKPRPENLVA